jgi:hypothetical protein
MRTSCVLLLAASLLSGCFDDASQYAQRLVGSWRADGMVMGKPTDSQLHILREGDYILDNGGSAKVAQMAPSGRGRWSVLRDELELLAMQASPLSGVGLEQVPSPARLEIVSLQQDRLVTRDNYGVKVEWVRINPLN